MYLVNTATTELELFPSKYPPYAILSHTWESQEVLFNDIPHAFAKGGVDLADRDPRGPGWDKVWKACRRARREGYNYIWIDTCCIDKSSSAELQEAINSMFVWYKNAAVCYAFLSDLHPGDDNSAFSRCRWFTRGWTLQELIAPVEIWFFNSAWSLHGTRTLLNQQISATTGIDERYLNRHPVLGSASTTVDIQDLLRGASVAEKLSWAASRSTTRVEDRAYSLMGLFNINMPMLYGEGSSAFVRLQQEILRMTDDCTILAWGYNQDLSLLPSTASKPQEMIAGRGLFAKSPDDFRYMANFVTKRILGFRRPTFQLTQRGLEISMLIKPDPVHKHIVYGMLPCGPPEPRRDGPPQELVAMPLIEAAVIDDTSYDAEDEYLQNIYCGPVIVEECSLRGEANWRTICIRHQNDRLVKWTGWSERGPAWVNVTIEGRQYDPPSLRFMYPSFPLRQVRLKYSFNWSQALRRQEDLERPVSGTNRCSIEEGFCMVLAFRNSRLLLLVFAHDDMQRSPEQLYSRAHARYIDSMPSNPVTMLEQELSILNATGDELEDIDKQYTRDTKRSSGAFFVDEETHITVQFGPYRRR
ncbi:hypothetical protein OQA88_1455 [Cercophora sp. LCS_1]